MKKSVLRSYAKLIAQKGGNVQKGQDVIIRASLDQPEFVRMLTEECYKCGARYVRVEWSDLGVTRITQKRASLRALSATEEWEEAKYKHESETLPVTIWLESDDPDGLKGVDQAKMSKASQARYKVRKPYRDAMENKHQWCIAAVPGVEWAKKVFPNEKKNRAVEKLWEAILYTSRADGEDPIAAWDAHNKNLASRCDYLNSLGIDRLEYKASNGTDLTVGMIEDALFMGGDEATEGRGVIFNPNIPSEEVFISPKRGLATGVVHASKPLSYRGEVIDGFWLRFEEGKVVEAHAERGEALLREMIAMDEGASYLGECALVPDNSPISNSGILFYNTLFDENAACHLALGFGFTNTLRDYDRYTMEECHQKGINDSMIHVDFMIGTPDLSIVAVTRTGERIRIFENGNWAF
ncbi:MAG: aminopeptidase [Ruminococcaceae bacterium]|nr:aminopeptidase [Oscillospiraceae bacterium]